MQLSQYFKKEQLIRDAIFEKTMFPSTSCPLSICYALQIGTIEKINTNPNISAVLTTRDLATLVNDQKGVIVSNSPEHSYYELHNRLVEEGKMTLIDSPFIAPDAVIASSAIIGKHVIIGEGVEISEGAYVADNTIIGKNTFIGPYAIIGTRGMQNIRVDGKPFVVKFVGGVKIGENCEILAQAVVQRPYQSFFTEVGNYTKISVHASVGHGSKIGSNSMIAGNVTIAGNVQTGDCLWIGPSSVIADGVIIGKNVRVILGSVVVSNVSDDQTISGNFAMEHAKQLKNFSRLKKL